MWQQLSNLVDVHQRSNIRIIYWSLNILTFNFSSYFLCKCCIQRVAWFNSNDSALQWTTNQRNITQHIKQFMTSWLVIKYKRFIVDIAKFIYILMRHTHQVSKFINSFLRHWRVINYNRII